MELERTIPIQWCDGDFCVAFERPVKSYKSREEMQDGIYGFAVIKSHPVDDDDTIVIVSFIDLLRDIQLNMEDYETTVDHLIPVLSADETNEQAIDRYWDELDSQQN